MLFSAGLPLPKKLFVHEYITVNGQKMSKTVGNVIDPLEMIEKYGVDALRYYCLAKISPFVDSDFSEKKLLETYNADLANGLGNLVARVAKMCESAHYVQMGSPTSISAHMMQLEDYFGALWEFRFNDALAFIWRKIEGLDIYIEQEKPWKLIKEYKPHIREILAHMVDQVQEIAGLLEPFMPETAQKIEDQFVGPNIVSQKPLFPRI